MSEFSHALYKKKNNSSTAITESYFYTSNEPKNLDKVILDSHGVVNPYGFAMYKRRGDGISSEQYISGLNNDSGYTQREPLSRVEDYTYSFAMYKKKNGSEEAYSSTLDETNLQAEYSQYDFQGERHSPPPNRNNKVWEGIL